MFLQLTKAVCLMKDCSLVKKKHNWLEIEDKYYVKEFNSLEGEIMHQGKNALMYVGSTWESKPVGH